MAIPRLEALRAELDSLMDRKVMLERELWDVEVDMEDIRVELEEELAINYHI